jgi:Tfp pilus assembly protein PilF
MRTFLEQAVIEAPADPQAYVYIGELALREGRILEADLVYQKADSLTAKFDKSAKRRDILRPQILNGLALVAEARGDWGVAQKWLEAWLKFDPKSAPAMQRLARCFFQQKNAAGALEKLREAVKADPQVLTPEATLAVWYEQANDRENAKKWMATALKAAPKDLRTHLVASQWALEIGQLEDAQAKADTAMQIDPKDPKTLEAKILRGAIALFQKDYPTAERYCQEAHLQAPRDPRALNNLALALVEQKDGAKQRRALEYAETNVQQNPKDPEIASTAGWVLYKNRRVEDADKMLQQVISSGLQLSPDTAFYAAKVAEVQGRVLQARQLLEAALKSTGPFSMRQEAKALLEELKLAELKK